MNADPTPAHHPRRYVFCFPDLDTMLEVEETAGQVAVRATRDSFSRRRKEFFVQELVAEGFIPERFRWNPLAGPDCFCGVNWTVDKSWVDRRTEDLPRSNRLAFHLVCVAAAAWVGLMFALVLLA